MASAMVGCRGRKVDEDDEGPSQLVHCFPLSEPVDLGFAGTAGGCDAAMAAA